MRYTPYVIEKSGESERSYDLWSRLLKDNIIFLGEEIDDDVANSLIAQMLFLEKENPESDIQLYINSPGGSVSAGLAIYDVMRHVSNPISTTCVGVAASMGAILLSGGTKGKRMILPNSRVMIHQVSSGFRGTTSDINIQVKETNLLMDKLMEILSENTDRDTEQVRKDCDRDYWMSAENALEYGIVDRILKK